MKTDAASIYCTDMKQARTCSKSCRGKKWFSAPYKLRHHIDFDFVQCAAFDEGHLYFSSTENPNISIAERPEFRDEIIDVVSCLQRSFRLRDWSRRDYQNPLLAIGPRRVIFGEKVVSASAHDNCPDALEELAIIMLAEIETIVFEQPVEAVVFSRNEAVQARGDISKNFRQGSVLSCL